jgi:hypothetical protein
LLGVIDGPGQILNVVSEFVRHHVLFGQRSAAGAKPAGQLGEERGVEICVWSLGQ